MAELTALQIDLLNGGSPENQEVRLGQRTSGILADKVGRPVQVEETFSFAAANPTVLVMPFAAKLVDAVVHATATQAGGTVRIDRAGNAASDAIVCATNNAVTRMGTVVPAEVNFAKGDALRLTVAGAATAGIIRITFLRTGK